jgi:hypothetical protein
MVWLVEVSQHGVRDKNFHHVLASRQAAGQFTLAINQG